MIPNEFLPDLGTYLHQRKGEESSHIKGYLSIAQVSRYRDEYYSITGSCAMEDATYVATFDFDANVWETFAGQVHDTLLLDVRLPESEGHTIINFDPELPVGIDMIVQPGVHTEAVETRENYIPLRIQTFNNLELVPSFEQIEQRHVWWVRQTSKVLDTALRKDAEVLREFIQPILPYGKALPTDEFQQNLLLSFLLRHATDDSGSVDEVVDFMESYGFVDAERSTALKQHALVTIANNAETIGELQTMWVELLVWHIALNLWLGTSSERLVRELVEVWGIRDSNGVETLLREARYCIARPFSIPFPEDEVEEAILELAEEHGIQSVMQHRLERFSNAAWDHPELRLMIQPYVRNDLLRQLRSHEKSADLVSEEIAQRCEQNIKNISNRLKMFGTFELKVFPPNIGEEEPRDR